MRLLKGGLGGGGGGGASPWQRVGTIILPLNPGDSVDLATASELDMADDVPIYFDSAHTKSLLWDSTFTRFAFNDRVKIDTTLTVGPTNPSQAIQAAGATNGFITIQRGINAASAGFAIGEVGTFDLWDIYCPPASSDLRFFNITSGGFPLTIGGLTNTVTIDQGIGTNTNLSLTRTANTTNPLLSIGNNGTNSRGINLSGDANSSYNIYSTNSGPVGGIRTDCTGAGSPLYIRNSGVGTAFILIHQGSASRGIDVTLSSPSAREALYVSKAGDASTTSPTVEFARTGSLDPNPVLKITNGSSQFTAYDIESTNWYLDRNGVFHSLSSTRGVDAVGELRFGGATATTGARWSVAGTVPNRLVSLNVELSPTGTRAPIRVNTNAYNGVITINDGIQPYDLVINGETNFNGDALFNSGDRLYFLDTNSSIYSNTSGVLNLNSANIYNTCTYWQVGGPTPPVLYMSFGANASWGQCLFNGSSFDWNKQITTNANIPIVAGSNTSNASAVLQADSTTKGFLPPRMTTAQRNAITTPATGLLIYNTDTKSVDHFDGTSWLPTATKEEFFSAGGTETIVGTTWATKAVLTNSGAAFTFGVPRDFNSLVSLQLIGIPTAGAAGTGKDIDLTSEYATIGEARNTHSESDTTSTYTIGAGDSIWALDISGVFTNLTANDCASLWMKQNSVGGTINYLGIKMTYI